jgi:hypothetical protein
MLLGSYEMHVIMSFHAFWPLRDLCFFSPYVVMRYPYDFFCCYEISCFFAVKRFPFFVLIYVYMRLYVYMCLQSHHLGWNTIKWIRIFGND